MDIEIIKKAVFSLTLIPALITYIVCVSSKNPSKMAMILKVWGGLFAVIGWAIVVEKFIDVLSGI